MASRYAAAFDSLLDEGRRELDTMAGRSDRNPARVSEPTPSTARTDSTEATRTADSANTGTLPDQPVTRRTGENTEPDALAIVHGSVGGVPFNAAVKTKSAAR